MEQAVEPPGRWFAVIALPYADEGGFWDRDAGLFCRAFRANGSDSRLAAFGEARNEQDRPLILATESQMTDADWWAQWGLAGVVLYSWAASRFNGIAQAIRSAGIKLVLLLDTSGLVSPTIGRRMYFDLKYVTSREAGNWFPWLEAMVKTALGNAKPRHRGTMAHLEQASLLAVPTPLAKQRYARYLRSQNRSDLIARLRVVPHPVAECMKYEPAVKRGSRLIAVGAWERLQKNASLLVRVLGRVLGQKPDYSARIIGSGDASIRKLVERLPDECRARIEITGRLPHEHLPLHYNQSRIIFSTSHYESFHLPTAEALCCGCSFVGDARLPSMAYFASLGGCGTLMCDSSLNNLSDALLAEIEAWEDGLRDPAAISRAWTARLWAGNVARLVLKLN